MPKTFLAWFGLLALVALGLGTAAGLAILHDRVRIVVQADGTPDAAALTVAQLRDEVGQVQRDLRALAEAFAAGVQHLAAGQDEGEAEHAATLSAQLQKLQAANDQVSARVQGIVDGQQALRAILDDVAARAVAAAPAAGVPHPSVDESSDAAPTPPPAPGPAEAAAVTAAAPPTADAPPARRRSAFAFTLPSQAFRFDARQRFELLPSLSRVGFDAKSTLHDFTGVTSKLSGTVTLNLSAPGADCRGAIHVDAAALDTGLAGRNDAMREHLATAQHGEIVFVFASMTDVTVDAEALRTLGTVHGKLTIRGQTHDIAMPVRLHVDDSRRVHAEGEAKVLLSAYGVPVPSQLGMIKMEDEVKVWIALQARSLGNAAESDR